ncbi:MAG TPA: VOC family protein [Vicinamibacterales bacterium]|nr:VOC family protein [Vicinamibacterales bacterium]
MTITPFLWFDTQAEEAMNYYLSVFKNGKSKSVQRAGGRVIGVEFELEGQPFMALNGGAPKKFTESVSFFVSCDTQADIDRLWTTLIGDGGAPNRCGWLQDKYGLSWQIIPSSLGRLLSGGGDAARAGRVLNAMLQMDKLDEALLQRAYDGTEATV